MEIFAGFASCFFKDHRGIFAFGDNQFEQLGTGNTQSCTTPTKINFNGGKVKEIAAGAGHSIFLTENGNVYTCGWNNYGQLGTGDEIGRLKPTKLKLNFNNVKVKEIAAGGGYSIFLTDKGNVYACGGNQSGQLGTGDTKARNIPTKIKLNFNNVKVKEIAAGCLHSIFLTDKGNVYTCGNNYFGQLGTGIGNAQSCSTPTKIKINFNNVKVKEIAASFLHSIFLTDKGNVYTCGSNPFGQLGTGDTKARNIPTKINFNEKVKDIAAGNSHFIFLTEKGNVYACGCNRIGQLGTGDTKARNIPTKIKLNFNNVKVKEIAAGTEQSILLADNGDVYACGQLGTGDTKARNIPTKIFKLEVDRTGGESFKTQLMKAQTVQTGQTTLNRIRPDLTIKTEN